MEAENKDLPESKKFHDYRDEDAEDHGVVYSDAEDDYGKTIVVSELHGYLIVPCMAYRVNWKCSIMNSISFYYNNTAT